MKEQITDTIPLAVANTLSCVFQERVNRSPNRTAYIDYDPVAQQWEETSWLQMSDQVARWQAAFRQEKLNTGDRVAIMLKNCREWVMFDLAAQGLGLVTVPIYTNDRPENIGYILQDAGVRLLLLESNEQWQALQQIRNQLAGLNRIITLEKVDPMGLQSRLLSIDDWLPEQYDQDLQVLEVDPEKLASIVYTSGTTGRSKGVMLSHANILWNIAAGLKLISVYPEDKLLSFLPLSHALERTIGYYMPIVAGATVAYARSVPQLAEDLLSIKPTILIAVPRIFERVYSKIQDKLENDSVIARKIFNTAVTTGWQRFEHQQGRSRWSVKQLAWPLMNKLVASKIQQKLGGRLRFAVSGGAPLSPDIAKVFIGLGIPILQGYGLTETSPIISANPIENNLPASVGLNLPELEIKIGEDDELLCRSPSVMLGYWNNPSATTEVIDSEGWLRTGDKVKIEDEHIFITGRIKEIIVLANGEKVPPADMEMSIALDNLFDQVLVIGEGRPYLSALVTLNPEICEHLSINPHDSGEELELRLIKRISQHLDSFPGFAKIRRVSIVEEPWTIENGLMTPTLKIRRNRILERYADRVNSLYEGH
ncbi:MAG: long-chain fatty acid--CoA ligase [Pseudomonadota bacterium]